MKIFIAALLAIPGLTFAQAAAAAEPSPRDLHAAQCVAALEVNTQDLARQVKVGKEALRPLLLERLVSGTAFVGDTYLHGDSDEKQARELANQALEAQKSLPAPELAARQAACADEGAKLFASSNGLQQAVVKRLAKKRMEKLLGA
jgi:plasmid stability protein